MQLIVGAGLAGVAFTIPAPAFFQYTLAFFWLLAFSSATHDIAADGFYMLGLDKGDQAYFIGIRSTFYRIAMITGQGVLIILAGYFEIQTGLEPVRFSVTTQTTLEAKFDFPSPKPTGVSDELSFIYVSDEFNLSTKPIQKELADSLKKVAASENSRNGFTILEIPTDDSKESSRPL